METNRSILEKLHADRVTRIVLIVQCLLNGRTRGFTEICKAKKSIELNEDRNVSNELKMRC